MLVLSVSLLSACDGSTRHILIKDLTIHYLSRLHSEHNSASTERRSSLELGFEGTRYILGNAPIIYSMSRNHVIDRMRLGGYSVYTEGTNPVQNVQALRVIENRILRP